MAKLSHIGLDSAFSSVDSLKKELRAIEAEEERVKKELETLNSKKQAVLKELGKFNDEKYEADMLHLVYEQRHQNKK